MSVSPSPSRAESCKVCPNATAKPSPAAPKGRAAPPGFSVWAPREAKLPSKNARHGRRETCDQSHRTGQASTLAAFNVKAATPPGAEKPERSACVHPTNKAGAHGPSRWDATLMESASPMRACGAGPNSICPESEPPSCGPVPSRFPLPGACAGGRASPAAGGGASTANCGDATTAGIEGFCGSGGADVGGAADVVGPSARGTESDGGSGAATAAGEGAAELGRGSFAAAEAGAVRGGAARVTLAGREPLAGLPGVVGSRATTMIRAAASAASGQERATTWRGTPSGPAAVRVRSARTAPWRCDVTFNVAVTGASSANRMRAERAMIRDATSLREIQPALPSTSRRSVVIRASTAPRPAGAASETSSATIGTIARW